jgi:hypothetical protein
MDFLKSRFSRDGGRCVLVKGSKVPSNVELFVNVELLVSED